MNRSEEAGAGRLVERKSAPVGSLRRPGCVRIAVLLSLPLLFLAARADAQCAGHCETYLQYASCGCDVACSSYGDCCSDFLTVCGGCGNGRWEPEFGEECDASWVPNACCDSECHLHSGLYETSSCSSVTCTVTGSCVPQAYPPDLLYCRSLQAGWRENIYPAGTDCSAAGNAGACDGAGNCVVPEPTATSAPTATPAAPTSTPTSTPTPPSVTPTAMATPGLSCPTTPASCVGGFAVAQLLVKEKTAGKEQLQAKLAKGPAIAQATLGNPLAAGGTSYGLCIYGAAGTLVEDLVVDRAGVLCGAKPCWKSVGGAPPDHKGFAYTDGAQAAAGVKAITMKGGAAGKSMLLLKASNDASKGRSAMPTGITAALAGNTSATIQLRTSAGICFSAALADVKTSDGKVFQAGN